MNRGDSNKAIGSKRTGQQDSQRKISAHKEQNVCIFLISSKNSKYSLPYIQLEIDHEIAKCLDTLDRQGLKYLKETLRASKIFDLDDLR